MFLKSCISGGVKGISVETRATLVIAKAATVFCQLLLLVLGEKFLFIRTCKPYVLKPSSVACRCFLINFGAVISESDVLALAVMFAAPCSASRYIALKTALTSATLFKLC